MLITYCRNEEGAERLYLTARGSLEAWIEPVGPDGRWTCRIEAADGDTSQCFATDKAEPARRFLMAALAAAVGVDADSLMSVPFHRLASLATPQPTPGRRREVLPRKRAQQRGWVIAAPPR